MVAMHSGPPRRRRARPVADAPVVALLARLEDVTKGWLLALLEQAPLDEMPAILAADLARDGPRLCDAVIRALADDDDLRRLEPGGALELLAGSAGELAGADGTEAAMRAVDALHDVIWGALRGALPDPDPDQIAELAERLALVIGLVRAAALRRGAPGVMGGDEYRAARGPRAVEVPAAEPPAPAPAPAAVHAPTLAAGHAPAPAAGHAPAPPEKHPLWIGAFEEELVRAERTGAPLSLLLAELEDADRMLAVEEPVEATATFGRFAQAVRDAVRRQDILACESDSRAWVIARDTGRPGAQALAGRIASAVRGAPQWRGAPLTVTIGVAVVGEDGRDSASLIEAAEEARFAAAASGIAVVPGGPEPDESAS
jgi:GGDEF domain-containing protein